MVFIKYQGLISRTDLSLFWGSNLIQSDSWLSLSLFVKLAPVILASIWFRCWYYASIQTFLLLLFTYWIGYQGYIYIAIDKCFQNYIAVYTQCLFVVKGKNTVVKRFCCYINYVEYMFPVYLAEVLSMHFVVKHIESNLDHYEENKLCCHIFLKYKLFPPHFSLHKNF